MYKDYTRFCVNEFKDLINMTTFDVCESKDGYNDCPFYNTLYGKNRICEFSKYCRKNQQFGHANIKKLSELSIKYCFSEDNKKSCEIYKLLKDGKEVPKTMIAYGSMG